MDAIGLILTSRDFLKQVSQLRGNRDTVRRGMTLELDLETLRTAELKEAFDEFDKVSRC